jgi:superfamily II DNA or RNA helicase
MILEFVEKEPDKAYVSNSLWLPKAGIRVGPVQRALEFTVNVQGKQETHRMWSETKNHIVCPREFLSPSEYVNYKFPFVDLNPEFERVDFEDLVVPRNEEQEKAWQAFSQHDNGILNLGCGKGKTKLAVKKIAQRKVPTLVIVPDGGILDQWKRSIYGDGETPPGLKFHGKLGIIQGKTFDWKHPVTLALVTTLALQIRDGRIPEELFRYFGQIIYDEVHQIGAPVFSLTASPFYGDRIGLTATVQREDGLDPIYRYHIGEPFYTDLKQDLIPYIYFQQTPAKIDFEKAKINKTVNVSILRTMLGKDLSGNTYRYWCIKRALDNGRKILCLSHSKAQLRLFHKMFPGSSIIVSETDRDERTDLLRNSQICFAIARLGSVGVDDDKLDTLFWLTPFRSKVSLQQSMGRIQRFREGKKHPVMVVFEDWMAPPLKKLCSSIRTSLRHWGFKFDVFKPSDFEVPNHLPSDVQAVYDAEFKSLKEEEDDSEYD